MTGVEGQDALASAALRRSRGGWSVKGEFSVAALVCWRVMALGGLFTESLVSQHIWGIASLTGHWGS